MDQHRFDSLTRALTSVPSRRHLLRGLAGLAVASCGIATRLLPDAAAKKKRKKRKKPKQQRLCQPGDQFGAVNVPGTGAAASTPVLKQDQSYRLRASGFWSSNATRGQDAFADFALADPDTFVTTFMDVRLGLSVDGGSPDAWGDYNVSHVYEQDVIGQGAALSLRCNDVVHADNSGSVRVEIFCA
jgi:hypothetical protein